MACVALAFWAGIDTYKYVGLVGVVTDLIGFGLGLSSGPWVVNAEIYPTRLRGLGQASACTANWAANYVVAACVEIKILRRVCAQSSRRPPRHRCDACSMAWRCRFLAARPGQHGHIIAEN